MFSGFLNIPDVLQSILPEWCSYLIVAFAFDTVYPRWETEAQTAHICRNCLDCKQQYLSLSPHLSNSVFPCLMPTVIKVTEGNNKARCFLNTIDIAHELYWYYFIVSSKKLSLGRLSMRKLALKFTWTDSQGWWSGSVKTWFRICVARKCIHSLIHSLIH